MKTETFAIVTALVVLSVSLLTMNLAQPVMAGENNKCLGQQLKGSRDSGTLDCNYTDNQAAGAAKKLCQQTTDNKEIQCSSSQTGQGLQKNNPP